QEELDKSTTTTTIPKQQSQDKGKATIIEEPVKTKKKHQIRLDEEVTKRLQAEFVKEERLARERAQKKQEANVALIETWDDVQAKTDDDYQLAERLQADEQEELSDVEKATLFMQLLEKRRKFFAMFDKALKRVNTFEDFRTELVQEKEKRAGEELIQESTKKQKVEDDKETAKLKKLIEIITDKEEVAINAIPLAVKSPREDLVDLHKLVKAKAKSKKEVEDLYLLLLGDFKTMFEPHVEDEVWMRQQGYKVLEWKLYDSCGVHSLKMQSMHVYMLVEKTYPLTTPTLTMMLEKKLQIDYQSEMAYHLLKLVKKQLKK
nr:hypothetical protein [Tanacetum cinerariifolium]